MSFASHRRVCLLVAALVAVTACGGSGTGAPAGPSVAGAGSSDAPAVFTITASGISPKSLTVPAGTQVTFVNNDSIDHLMFSDPHPEHTDCPDINQVGFLSPGQSRQTGNMNVVQTCGFHDHNLPFQTSLQGTITTR